MVSKIAYSIIYSKNLNRYKFVRFINAVKKNYSNRRMKLYITNDGKLLNFFLAIRYKQYLIISLDFSLAMVTINYSTLENVFKRPSEFRHPEHSRDS